MTLEEINMFDNVAKVSGIFTKLITRLDKIVAREMDNHDVQVEIIKAAKEKQLLHIAEIEAAQILKSKLESFLK